MYINRGLSLPGLGHYNSVNIPTLLDLPHRVLSITCGDFHTIINSEEGLFVCGDNGPHAQLGLGMTPNVNILTKLNTPIGIIKLDPNNK